jgi:hypothetical protein
MNTSTLEDKLAELSARRVNVTEHHLIVELEDGRTLSVPLSWYPRLLNGTPAERANVEILPGSLHWGDLNEDLSIRGLLLGNKSGESSKSLRRWLDFRARGEKEPIPELPLPPKMAKELEAMGIWRPKDKHRMQPKKSRSHVRRRAG